MSYYRKTIECVLNNSVLNVNYNKINRLAVYVDLQPEDPSRSYTIGVQLVSIRIRPITFLEVVIFTDMLPYSPSRGIFHRISDYNIVRLVPTDNTVRYPIGLRINCGRHQGSFPRLVVVFINKGHVSDYVQLGEDFKLDVTYWVNQRE
jgi:hypothetical protein